MCDIAKDGSIEYDLVMNTNPDKSQKGYLSPKQEYLEKLSTDCIRLQHHLSEYGITEINKIIFSVGTGAFVISISLVAAIQANVVYPAALIASWIFLAISIVGNVFAHNITIWVADRNVKHINDSRASGFANSWEQAIENDKDIMRWIRWASGANILVATSLGIGILAMVLFAALNIGRSEVAIQNYQKLEGEVELLRSQLKVQDMNSRIQKLEERVGLSPKG